MRLGDFRDKDKIHFFLVEDDPNHAEIFHRTMAEVPFPHDLFWVQNGEDAIRYIKKLEPYENVTSPDVIFLDLKLPRKSGLEVLKEIRESRHCSSVPIVILSTSDSEVDLQAAYKLQANSYLVKPLEAKTFKDMIVDMARYWGTWNYLPTQT